MGNKRRKTKEIESVKLDQEAIEVKQEDLLEQIKPCDLNKRYIFISYSSNDWEQVYRDVIELQNRGYEVWLDDKNLDKKEESWEKAALDAIRNVNCRLLIFYVSEHSLTSRNCYNEVMETLSETSKKRHNKKAVPIVCIDVMPIKEITDFGEIISDKIEGDTNIDHTKKNELLDTLSDFLDDVFKSNNKRVRVPSAKADKRKVEYYSEIVQTFDGCNLSTPRQARHGSATGQTKPTPPIPQKAEEPESPVFSSDNDRSSSGKQEQSKPYKGSKQTIIKTILLSCFAIALLAVITICGKALINNHKIVEGKDVIVLIDGEVSENGSVYNVKAGSQIEINAFPKDQVKAIVCKFNFEEDERVYENQSKKVLTVSDTGEYGFLWTLDINVLYSDGLYLDNQKKGKTNNERYSFIQDEPRVENKSLSVSLNGSYEFEPRTSYGFAAGNSLEINVSPEELVEKVFIQWGTGEIKEYDKANISFTIPENTDVGTVYSLNINALFKDGYYLDNHDQEDTKPETYNFYITKPTIQNKAVSVSVNGELVDDGCIFAVGCDSFIDITASPSEEVEYISVKFLGWDEPKIYTKQASVREYIQRTARVGETYTMLVNVYYSDGLFLDNKGDKETESKIYKFVINKELVQNKKIIVDYCGTQIEPGTYSVHAGDTLTVSALPSEEVESISIRWETKGTPNREYYGSVLNVKIPEDAVTGQIYIMNINAYYSDGYFIDNKTYGLTEPFEYTFNIID